MNRVGSFVCMFVLLAAPSASWGGEMLDRIVATVNGHIILQSDWDYALRCQAFEDGRTLDQLPPDEHKAALDRLIDQELLREQMHSSSFQHASEQEVAQRIQEVRRQYPEAATEAGWQAELVRGGLSATELNQHVSQQLDLMRLVDARLRPNISIDSKSIESYYNQQLLPQLRQSGAKEVPLAEVTPKIKELLTQEQMNQMLLAWLQNLRSGSEIRETGAKGELQ
ncbi:MAG TPA: SurA N-terminal domain-containing protein [Terriglobales bacterium]|nr:SurA N-terminal domain-containing protein [Terriglobales bacterium]